MNKKELESEVKHYKEGTFLFLFLLFLLTIAFIIVGSIDRKNAYNQGVNDTLNNYTCTNRTYFNSAKYEITNWTAYTPKWKLCSSKCAFVFSDFNGNNDKYLLDSFYLDLIKRDIISEENCGGCEE